MIPSYKRWQLIKLTESLGDGTESFTEKIDMHEKLRNLDFDGCPSEWGIEIDGARGNMKYSLELDVNSGGLEDIYFYLEEINLEIDVVIGYDEHEDQIVETREFSVKRQDIKTEVKVEINELPFYMQNLTIDFRHAENLDGELLMDKIEYSMEIGTYKK